MVDVLLLDCGGFDMGSLFGVLGVPRNAVRESRFALVSLIVVITLCPHSNLEANTCCVDIGEIYPYINRIDMTIKGGYDDISKDILDDIRKICSS
ncbi:hypothetical protein AAMO2058_001367800 [Amorphochlora amoebiformis]